MELTAIGLNEGQIYILKRDFIQTPQIRHNFGTEVEFLGYISENKTKAMIRIKGTLSDGFMIPITHLREKE